jgi:transposase
MKTTRFVGLDVHAETIAVAVAESNGELRSLGTIPNRPEAIRRLVKKLAPVETLRACYEAGPCGYVLYWQLTELGVACEVVAPTLIPEKSGDRVKTDRRDAQKLARCYRAGDLTAVWVPDATHEALRDLVRARESAKKDQLRARNRLTKLLLRHGRRPPDGVKSGTLRYRNWVNTVHFEEPALEAAMLDYVTEVDHVAERVRRLEHAIDLAVERAPEMMRAVIAALQVLRGVAKLTATTIVVELGQLSRFAHAKQLMGYTGLVSCEDSSGGRVRRGRITKTGNAHLRRVLVEAAWGYKSKPYLFYALRKRQGGQSETVKAIGWRAQHRLHERYWKLTAKGKAPLTVATAVARELAGFIWAIGREVESGYALAGSAKKVAA